MAKRTREFQSIEELMGSVIKENKLTKGLTQLSLEEHWAKLMGNGVVSYTQSIEIQGKTLIVKLNSSVLREELSYGKEKIVKLLNEEFGEKLISKVLLT
ncbi:Protein of unknown function [Lutibacter oricola]|uniref:RNA-binding protein n=1 Tax=Lutibacter oricola TaxID=762486 RepID=A0A1H3F334_9FLAO|nr:DUF721 domain-containing protein [Lutibacter oricola]SDX84604.1 Protein of unknown function [Lutibacter oricola]